MELTTKIEISSNELQIKHTDRVLLLGSCFADNIGEKLSKGGFDCLHNPFGTLYNPASISAMLSQSVIDRRYTAESRELFRDERTGQWHSWMHHSMFSSADREHLITQINDATHLTSQRIKDAGLLIVTFGTSIIYRLKADGMLVANCHKQADRMFVRERMSHHDIVNQWVELLRQIHDINPKMKVIMTVSPIRHKRDGLHVNQLSKAVLLLAVDDIVCKCNDDGQDKWVQYFPSYEIMMDELRDYRYYADDMVHPSPLAVEYIWERFADTYFTADTKSIIRQCNDICRALSHRPSDPESESYRKFIDATNDKIDALKEKYPYLCISKR